MLHAFSGLLLVQFISLQDAPIRAMIDPVGSLRVLIKELSSESVRVPRYFLKRSPV